MAAVDPPRVAVDANVLISAVIQPRWPYEVMREAIAGSFQLCAPERVLAEARRNLPDSHRFLLEQLLREAHVEVLRAASPDELAAYGDVVRDATDVPIAASLLASGVGVFVSMDRDFTEPGATAPRFSDQVVVELPAVFLRTRMSWTSEALEEIRRRTWVELLRQDET
jgi:predicted nucleic acid-binding protein